MKEKNMAQELCKPTMTIDEIDTLTSFLDKSKTVLEWGIGGSTIFFSQMVKLWYGIEHSIEWYLMVNATLRKKGYNNVRTNYVYANFFNSIKTYPLDDIRKTFKNYSEYIRELKEEYYDIVIIDGRNRVECAKQALPYCDYDTIIFVHDWNREYYHKILTLGYKVIGIVDTLAMLRIR